MLPRKHSGDVGVTTALSDGRVLRVFGDTTSAEGFTPRMVDNSLLVSSGRCVAEVATPGGGPVMSMLTGDRAYWPTSALTVPAGRRDLVIVGCSRVACGTGEDGLYAFSYRGASLAVFAVEGGEASQRITTVDITADNADQEQLPGVRLWWVMVSGSTCMAASSPRGARARAPMWPVRGSRNSGSMQRGSSGTALGSREVWRRIVRSCPPSRGYCRPTRSFGGVGGTSSSPSREGSLAPTSDSGRLSAQKARGAAIARCRSGIGGAVAYQPLAHPELPTPGAALLLIDVTQNGEHRESTARSAPGSPDVPRGARALRRSIRTGRASGQKKGWCPRERMKAL